MDILRHYWTKLQASLLLVPLLMSVVAIAAATLLIDSRMLARPLPVCSHSGSASAARDLLNALLGGMIAMFSLVLSITIVVLTVAASQIGSRLIRSFLDDRATQFVIGLFLATLLYLLSVLPAIDEREFAPVPHLAIAVATGLCAICLLALLYYVNKLAHSIVFDHAASRVAHDIRRTCAVLHDRCDEDATPAPDAERDVQAAFRAACAFPIGDSGYVQSISYASLVELARRLDVVIRLDVRPGQWVNAETVCIAASQPLPERARRQVRNGIIVGSERTPTQDVEYGLQRLVEMAVRALSPGVNDVFTALAAVDNLGASVAFVFARPPQTRVLRDADGGARVIRDVSTPSGILEAAFNQIRQAGAAMPAVSIRLLDALGRLATNIRSEEQRDATLQQIEAVYESARCDAMIRMDAQAVVRRYRDALACVRGALTPEPR